MGSPDRDKKQCKKKTSKKKFSALSRLFLPLQDIRGTDQLHLLDCGEDGLLLAQPAGGRLLHPRSPFLLPLLRPVGPAAAGPAQPHPGTFHRGPHHGDAAHHRPGGLEEQTQRGHRVAGLGQGG